MEAVTMIPRPSRGAPENLAFAHRMRWRSTSGLTPLFRAAAGENWQAPGNLNSDGTNLLIYAATFRHVFCCGPSRSARFCAIWGLPHFSSSPLRIIGLKPARTSSHASIPGIARSCWRVLTRVINLHDCFRFFLFFGRAAHLRLRAIRCGCSIPAQSQPHHGLPRIYTYLEKVLRRCGAAFLAPTVAEFMPGKQMRSERNLLPGFT